MSDTDRPVQVLRTWTREELGLQTQNSSNRLLHDPR